MAGVPQPTFTTPTITTFAETNSRAVLTVLRVGKYERPIIGTNTVFWSLAAEEIVKDVAAWVDVNRAALAKYSADKEDAER